MKPLALLISRRFRPVFTAMSAGAYYPPSSAGECVTVLSDIPVLLCCFHDAGLEKLSRRQFDFPFFRVLVLAVEDGDMADDAGCLRTGAFGEFGGQRFLLFLEIVEADLDEFVRFERFVRGLDNRIGQALFTDEDDGLEVVCAAAEKFSLR
jgi:hypothetical protein